MGHAPLPDLGTHFGCQIAATACGSSAASADQTGRRRKKPAFAPEHVTCSSGMLRPSFLPRNDAGLVGQYNATLAGTTLAPGIGRSLIGLFWLRTFEPSRILFVDADELDQVFDSEVSECLDAVVSGAIDPDDAVLDLHVTGDVSQPVFVLRRGARRHV